MSKGPFPVERRYVTVEVLERQCSPLKLNDELKDEKNNRVYIVNAIKVIPVEEQNRRREIVAIMDYNLTEDF